VTFPIRFVRITFNFRNCRSVNVHARYFVRQYQVPIILVVRHWQVLRFQSPYISFIKFLISFVIRKKYLAANGEIVPHYLPLRRLSDSAHLLGLGCCQNGYKTANNNNCYLKANNNNCYLQSCILYWFLSLTEVLVQWSLSLSLLHKSLFLSMCLRSLLASLELPLIVDYGFLPVPFPRGLPGWWPWNWLNDRLEHYAKLRSVVSYSPVELERPSEMHAVDLTADGWMVHALSLLISSSICGLTSSNFAACCPCSVGCWNLEVEVCVSVVGLFSADGVRGVDVELLSIIHIETVDM